LQAGSRRAPARAATTASPQERRIVMLVLLAAESRTNRKPVPEPD